MTTEQSRAPRITLIDTENAPNLGYVWGKWEQNVIEYKSNWYFLSFAHKELGSKTIKCHTLPDYSPWKKDREDDKALVEAMWHVLDQSDIVIAHNGDRFDLRKANARFVAHGMKPPSPYKSIDTLKIARRFFQFDSNRLDDLGQYLGVGRKLPHTGKHLWFGCMAGDPKAWATMKKYNIQDVSLLERIYLKLRPWATTHPNINHLSRCADACPTCQSKNIQYRGFSFTRTGQRQRLQCRDCGKWATTGGLIKLEDAA